MPALPVGYQRRLQQERTPYDALIGGIGDVAMGAQMAGYVADTPGAYTRGALAGKPGQRVSGEEMLGDWGKDRAGAGALALGIEALTDPLNVIPAMGMAKTYTKAQKARHINAQSLRMRAKGAMPEELLDTMHPSLMDTKYSVKPGMEKQAANAYRVKNAEERIDMAKYYRSLTPEKGSMHSLLNKVAGPSSNLEMARDYAAMPDAEALSELNAALKHLDPTDVFGSNLRGVDPFLEGTSSPKKFYHGTQSLFDEVNLKHSNPEGLAGPGFYGTDAPTIASEYTMKDGPYARTRWSIKPDKEQAVLDAYLKTQYPDEIIQDMPEAVRNKHLNALRLQTLGKGPESDVAALLHSPGDPWHFEGITSPELWDNNIDVKKPGNVRMHYVHSKNPFDLDKEYPYKQIFPATDEHISGVKEMMQGAQSDADMWRQKARDTYDTIDRDFGHVNSETHPDYMKSEDASENALHYIEKRLYYSRQADKFDREVDQYKRFLDRYESNIGGFDALNQLDAIGPGASRDKSYEAFDHLRGLGYDSLTHMGGGRAGGGKEYHKVVIAIDPSQVYAPYVAPRKQQVPSLVPQAKQAAAYNALKLLDTEE